MDDLLRIYDFPTPMQHSPSRIDTITPLQQLFVLNSPFIGAFRIRLANSDASQNRRPIKSAIFIAKFCPATPRPPRSTRRSDLSEQSHRRSTSTQTLLATNEEIFWP